ncbi:MAG: outer membrane protein transport protein [Myxococcales bacterium]|nr:outer membrane protein transport protein [Myxococcales bacterium]
MNSLIVTLVSVAHGGSLDLLEVGGVWGSPGATNPTAVWFNPASLAAGDGHRALVEVAPTFGAVTAARTNPEYGPVDPSLFDEAGAPDTYDYSGTDRLAFTGVVPFVGIASDLGIDGLGVGAALYVPIAKGGKLDDFDGANRFALRDGSIQHIYTTLAASYQLADRLSLGASGSLITSRYYADTDATIYADIAAGQADANGGVIPDTYQDGYAEDPAYTTGSVFDLSDTAFTFGVGAHLVAVEDLLSLSLSYNHGARLANTGDLTLSFACPPTYDTLSRAAAEEIGTCNPANDEGTVVTGDGGIAYRLPGRIHLGAVITPMERLRLEAMGGYVFWSVFDNYDVTTLVAPTEFQDLARSPGTAAEAARLATQDRQWARDNRDTFWLALDGKVQVLDPLIVGARVTYDRAAVPDAMVSANNYDANNVILAGMVDVTPVAPISVSLSFSHHFLAQRTVTDSPFGVGADLSAAETRLFYPSANGTYTGAISRIGIALRGRLGSGD